MKSPSLFSLAGKRILVTGAAGHIGKALCERLLEAGAVVYAVDKNSEELALWRKGITSGSERLSDFSADLADENERVALVREVTAKTDRLDGAVFAAAFVGTSDLEGWAVDFAEQSIATWRDALELNLTAPFHLSQLLSPALRAGVNPSIVNVGSIYGSLGPNWSLYEGLGMSNPAAYAASKGGLLQLTRWLTSTLGPQVRVNSVSPGGIARHQPGDFDARYSANVPLGRMARESDIVGPISFLLSSAAAYVTGQDIVVDGGYSVI